MERLTVPQGQFTLYRHPLRPDDPLRAWDAADEYLLRHAATLPWSRPSPGEGAAVVIVNDGHGALAAALAATRPCSLSDSYLAHAAARANFARNGVDLAAVSLVTSFDLLSSPVDVVLLKVPKTLALLEDQLHRLRPALREGASVIGAGMAKHIHTSTLDLFERILGPTRTSLAEKKARLIFCAPDARRAPPRNPWPRTYTVAPGGEVITGHAGVFSPDHLDIGTRFFLDQLAARFARSPVTGTVVDLGCGNGVVGTLTARQNPAAELTFLDESYRAVASAEATFRANLGPDRAARFAVGNGLFELAAGPPVARGSVDVILNNPPFHAEQSMGDETAREMFREAHAALRPGGELWVVGNLHLDYKVRLQRLFGACETVAANGKFAVLRATR